MTDYKKEMIAFIVVFIVMGFQPILATIIEVPEDYSTIQAGIDASLDGDTVLVEPYTYFENIKFNGHNLMLGSLFLTTGDTSYISQTIIDGNSSGSVITCDSSENITVTITGFKIQNGVGNISGGGIFCYCSDPTITHNIISENGAVYGGGICCVCSNPKIFNNIISGNSSFYGGGIFCYDSDPLI
ncbi:MAG: hypothetical protein J7K40_05170 [candidate division Zixibacteria bacterium]|nr:hypothetical protein [candidate division Zixibacteria bacterium]